VGSRYVEPRRARHSIVMMDGVERVVVPMRRNWFVALFIPVWLAGWTAGGIGAMWQFAKTGEPFLAFWLLGWALGWIFALSMLVGQFGRETLAVRLGDLEVRRGLGPLSRRWLYRGSAITRLAACEPTTDPFWMARQQVPFFLAGRAGAVKFDYGADSIYLANGIDGPEGRIIAEWLSRRLPASASA